MALTNDQKIQLMKEAYATGYKGSFTELFQQNDPEPGTDPMLEPMDINPMDVPANSPAKVSLGTDMPPMEMRNQEAIEQANAAPSQELVQSFQSETAGSMPTGERVETVLENPSQYQEGGYKLDNNYADNYIKDYLKKKGGYKWDLEKLKDFNKK